MAQSKFLPKVRSVALEPAEIRAFLAGHQCLLARPFKQQPEFSGAAFPAVGSWWYRPTGSGWPRDRSPGPVVLGSCYLGRAGDEIRAREAAFLDTRRGNWLYAADGGDLSARLLRPHDPARIWCRPRQMPPEACRLVLRVEEVLAHPAHDLNEQHAYSLGFRTEPCAKCDESGEEPDGPFRGEPCGDCAGDGKHSCLDALRKFWLLTYGPESWWANPWIWLLQCRVEPIEPELTAEHDSLTSCHDKIL